MKNIYHYLFAYRTAVHISTGISLFELMYGRSPLRPPIPEAIGYDVASYQSHLHAKMSQLVDFVEGHLADSAHKQKSYYDSNTTHHSFKAGDPVWLSSP